MRSINTFVSVAAGLIAAIAVQTSGAQTYYLMARATATDAAPVVDETDEGGFVSAANSGGSGGADNPSSVESLTEGGPRSFTCSVSADAQSLGPAASGSGRAHMIAIDDELFFTASESFRVRVSMSRTSALGTSWSGDGASIVLTSPWRVRASGGGFTQSQEFGYAERDDGTDVITTIDDPGPYEFDLEPGESLLMSADAEISVFTAAEFMVADGNAHAELDVTFFIEVIEGDAAFDASTSGNTYGPPPCNDADFVEPFGLHDLADTVAFATAFLANDPLADLDDSGLNDLTDVVLFVQAFLAGCP